MGSLLAQSYHVAQNFDDTWDLAFPRGDKSPTLTWNLVGLASLENIRFGTNVSVNARALLVGDGSSSAVISMVYVSGSALAGWTAPGSGNNATNAGSTVSGGVFIFRATYLALVVDSPPIAWSFVSSGGVKWNPGHYGASGGVAGRADLFSKFQPEIDDMLKDSWVKGYRLFYSWAGLEEGTLQLAAAVSIGAKSATLKVAPRNGDRVYTFRFDSGEYRDVTVSGTSVTWTTALTKAAGLAIDAYKFDLVDQILAYCATHFATPKQLVIAIVPMSFSGGTRGARDFSRIPQYLTESVALYGSSPDGQTSGWWGPPTGATDGAYSAALWRPAVAKRYALLGKAMGDRYNSNAHFEAVLDQENSAVVGPANNYPPRATDYNDDTYEANIEMYLAAWRGAFPNTNIACENTFMYGILPAQKLTKFMVTGGYFIAPSSADSSGQSYYDNGRLANSWGQSTYFGVPITGSSFTGPDYRPVIRAMMDVEGPDIGASSKGAVNNTPLDIIRGANITVKASHLFWCHIPDGRTNPPKWADVTPVLRDNPLTNVGYPSAYP
jgi:hypothetical protein